MHALRSAQLRHPCVYDHMRTCQAVSTASRVRVSEDCDLALHGTYALANLRATL